MLNFFIVLIGGDEYAHTRKTNSKLLIQGAQQFPRGFDSTVLSWSWSRVHTGVFREILMLGGKKIVEKYFYFEIMILKYDPG